MLWIGLCFRLALIGHGMRLTGLNGQDLSMHGLDMHEIVHSQTRCALWPVSEHVTRCHAYYLGIKLDEYVVG